MGVWVFCTSSCLSTLHNLYLAQVIPQWDQHEQVIPCTYKFTRETFFGILEAEEISLRKSGDFPRIETAFNSLSSRPTLCRSVSTSGYYASNSRGRIEEEGIALLVRRELEGKKIFKYWTCNKFGHYSSKCPKRVKNYKRNFKPRKPRECLYANGEDLEASVER